MAKHHHAHVVVELVHPLLEDGGVNNPHIDLNAQFAEIALVGSDNPFVGSRKGQKLKAEGLALGIDQMPVFQPPASLVQQVLGFAQIAAQGFGGGTVGGGDGGAKYSRGQAAAIGGEQGTFVGIG